jgi:hypothetical protein
MKRQPRKMIVKVLSIPEHERHFLEQRLNQLLAQIARELGDQRRAG